MVWLITVGLAIGIAALQLWLRLVSRQPPPGKKHALKRDDYVFWIDWTVTAAVAFAASLIDASLNNKAASPGTTMGALAVILVGLIIMPFGFRMTSYDSSGNLNSWSMLIGSNLFALGFLSGAVTVGVKIYG
ncbi:MULTISPECIES: hypothetical protein [unclassified Streptomyces]|uniref:hypothetical protein n=1 Tax=unclassified Streptomyces TaxID=2593676 RepID=UPI00365E4BA6